MTLKLSSINLALRQPLVRRFSSFGVCLLFTLGASLLTSCSKKEDNKAITISEAQKKFEAKCRDEFELQVITRMAGQTLYIYFPTDKPIFDYEAQKENTQSRPDESTKTKFSVQYSDVKLIAGQFNIEYDIVDKKKSQKDNLGYSGAYTESYTKAQMNILSILNDIFSDLKEEKNTLKPIFIVFIITDIKKGIETRITFYLQDFKRFWTGDLPSDEFYNKRIWAETKGGESLIGDEVGTHIEFKDITMGEFLSKQINNRIGFKFQRSDFPPDPDFDDAIVAIVADTTRYYSFNEFRELRLHNLRSTKKFIFTKSQLASFGDDKPEDKQNASKAKLIHIVFENGKIHIPDEEAAQNNQEK